jgi:hypothetical protein
VLTDTCGVSADRQDWLPERASHNKLDLFKLTFIKDDANKLPYVLVDEFSFAIVNIAKGQKHLLSEEALKALQESKDKQFHPPHIQTLLKTAHNLQKMLESQPEAKKSKLAG